MSSTLIYFAWFLRGIEVGFALIEIIPLESSKL